MSDQVPLILLADDEPHILEVLTIILEDAAFRVVAVESGEAALQVAIKQMPDAIISDLSMPGPTGLELARHLSHYPKTAHIPLVMLTAHSLQLKPSQIERTNIVHVFSKPFSPTALKDTMCDLVQHKLAA